MLVFGETLLPVTIKFNYIKKSNSFAVDTKAMAYTIISEADTM